VLQASAQVCAAAAAIMEPGRRALACEACPRGPCTHPPGCVLQLQPPALNSKEAGAFDSDKPANGAYEAVPQDLGGPTCLVDVDAADWGDVSWGYALGLPACLPAYGWCCAWLTGQCQPTPATQGSGSGHPALPAVSGEANCITVLSLGLGQKLWVDICQKLMICCPASCCCW
jgi:hypothetical protein